MDIVRSGFLCTIARKALTFPLNLARRIARAADVRTVWSYSQEGEDLVLRRYLEGRTNGFYVDVGAHDPKRFSNTHLFYERGWRGINIEPSPAAMKNFMRERPEDENVMLAVAELPAELTYYIFDDPALNSFDSELKSAREAETSYRVVGTARIAADRLENILDRSVPHGRSIDFMSIDVEGFDLQVLRSNDWTRFRPEFVLVEALEFSMGDREGHPVDRFMTGVGYELVAKTMNTLFYREIR